MLIFALGSLKIVLFSPIIVRATQIFNFVQTLTKTFKTVPNQILNNFLI